MAAWIRFIEGRNECGEELALDDPETSMLTTVVRDSADPVGAALSLEKIFGRAGNDETLKSAVSKAYQRLKALGARATISTEV